MAVYQIFNKTYNEAIQFSSIYDYNSKECLTIPPRGLVGGTNGVLGDYPISIDYGKHKMIGEIFAFATKYPDKLAITKDGAAVTYDAYKQDFP